MRRKKSLTISHTQHKTPPIPTPFQPMRKNGDVKKRRPILRGRKSKKKTGEKLKEGKVVKLK